MTYEKIFDFYFDYYLISLIIACLKYIYIKFQYLLPLNNWAASTKKTFIISLKKYL